MRRNPCLSSLKEGSYVRFSQFDHLRGKNVRVAQFLPSRFNRTVQSSSEASMRQQSYIHNSSTLNPSILCPNKQDAEQYVALGQACEACFLTRDFQTAWRLYADVSIISENAQKLPDILWQQLLLGTFV